MNKKQKTTKQKKNHQTRIKGSVEHIDQTKVQLGPIQDKTYHKKVVKSPLNIAVKGKML